tara:strand:- start:436 stop:2622 length:2187 start_codon:yes stop_codon:yes gene_type:complete
LIVRYGIRSTLTLFSAFFFHIGFAQEQYSLIKKESYYGLQDQDGDVVIAPVYDQIGWSSGNFEWLDNLIGYSHRGNWGLLNIKTKKTSPAIYYKLSVIERSYILASIKGNLSNQLFYGIIDSKGDIKISCNYFSIESGYAGYVTSTYDYGVIKKGFYDKDFNLILSPKYREIKVVNEQVVMAQNFLNKWSLFRIDGIDSPFQEFDQFAVVPEGICVEKGGKYGLLDFEGRVALLETEYKRVYGKNEVIRFPLWEVRNLDLKHVITVRADSLAFDADILVAYCNGSQERLVNPSSNQFIRSNEKLSAQNDGFMLNHYEKSDTWSVMDTEGKPIILRRDSIHYDAPFFYAFLKGKWEVYNKFGLKVSDKAYQHISNHLFSMIPVKNNQFWGFLDFKGDEIISLKYDSIGAGYNYKIAINYLGKWGVIDLFEHWIVAPIFDELAIGSYGIIVQSEKTASLLSFEGDVIYEIIGDIFDHGSYLEIRNTSSQRGILSPQGDVILDPFYDQVGKVGHLFWGKDSLGTVLLDESGKYLIRSEDGISEVLNYCTGLYMIKKDGKYGFINEKGNLRIANRYDSLLCFSDERFGYKLGNKWGFIDTEERLIVQPIYDQVFPYREGVAVIGQKGKFGLIDLSGKLILSLRYVSIDQSLGNYLLEGVNGAIGIANSSGDIMLRTDYDDIIPIRGDLLVVIQDDRVGLMNYRGYIKLALKYASIKEENQYLIIRHLSDRQG